MGISDHVEPLHAADCDRGAGPEFRVGGRLIRLTAGYTIGIDLNTRQRITQCNACSGIAVDLLAESARDEADGERHHERAATDEPDQVPPDAR